MSTKRKKDGVPTVVSELVERMLDIDRRLAGRQIDEARQDLLMAEEGLIIGQIVAATPATLSDCIPMLMIAADRAQNIRIAVEDRQDGSPETVERDAQHAADLSAVLARVLRFLAAEAKIDLDKIGARHFLDENEHFPEYGEAVCEAA